MRQTLSVPEVAALLGVSSRLVYDEIERGYIRALSIGRRRVVPVVEVERLLGGPIVLPEAS
jgi:excisionase family DNA binding protein